MRVHRGLLPKIQGRNSVSMRASVLATTAVLVLCGPALADMSSAVKRTTQDVKGLSSPAEIIIDFWGIPHIYAANQQDAFFLQGYNAARDRLWQIDLWRKRGLGLLAKDFGPSYAAQDRAARLFLYRGDMDQEWAAYGPHARSYTEAFVAGVNAFVQEIRDGTRPLPLEFKVAGSQPDLWRPQDAVRVRSHGLTRNVSSEVRRARVACAAGLEADKLRVKLEPAWTTTVPTGLDPCFVPKDVLGDYELATKEVSFTAPMKRAEGPDSDRFLAEADEKRDSIRSNNWVVAGSRTATGRPILANDPHRAHGVPSLRYIVHLNTPKMSVIGAGEPALPGISIGHNGQIAFGLTIFSIDQEDLYVYELNPTNPNEYRYGSGWEPMRIEHERLEVKGEAPREIEMRFTRHGPVLAQDAANRRAFAMRSVWFEPGTSAYFGSSDYMTAKDWKGFLEAMARWGAPSENQVYADTTGNIGWIPAGKTPIRDNWDGLMPVPGDGRYEWKGFMRLEDLPQSYNPPQGWFATANQMNLPPDYPIREKKVGFEWTNPSRFQRISEVLSAKDKVTLADAMALQNDDASIVDRRLAALLRPLEAADPQVAKALRLVRDWDGRVSEDSGAAAVVEVWLSKHLGKAVVAKAVPANAQAVVANGDIAAILNLLENPDASLGSEPAKAGDAILLDSFAAAVGEVGQLLGTDSSAWAWGKLHHAQFEHALAPLADPATKAQMTVGRLAMGGSAYNPRAATYRPSDFRVTAGASFRMVLDVGNWDQSVTINTPGQSGDPFNPHYRDLAPLWASGAYVPLLYSRGAVEGAASEVIALRPSS